MKFGEHARAASDKILALGISLVALTVPQLAFAAAPAAAASAAPSAAAAAGSYVPMTPTEGKGMPVPDAIHLQDQYSPLGEYAHWFHNDVLMPMITIIVIFVLALLVWVMVRYNSKSNPTPSKTSHNTLIEVVWTLVPVLVLVGVAIPSISLLAKQYKPAPAKSLTIKATGNQWFWSYTYPDNGGFEVVSNMLNIPGQPVVNNGVREVGSKPYDGPSHLEVDNRMVVPAGEPIRLQVTGADVIHSFAVPSLWFKLDGVPGRINEKMIFIEKPGVYYGQCSELCGARHGYMPIAVEALPRAQFNAWVLQQSGGVIDHQPKPAAAAAPAAEAAAPAASEAAAPAAAASAAAAPAATATASASPAPKA
ncbi:cytochrome c oxidase subunit II [Novosphingobium sp. G106]|uniref:cytochrome c oxidase subunit II n=1 Tax=Novosphingobium sp. G106 TaxID=2849500 RepID=UPI001C2DE4F6|nr:cytochrome c oxidase subunit II [Novosphingobium sp. G106]MBV1691147.1 cytochrome c oxidase subunit II [Novosphingobium sp. G106]